MLSPRINRIPTISSLTVAYFRILPSLREHTMMLLMKISQLHCPRWSTSLSRDDNRAAPTQKCTYTMVLSLGEANLTPRLEIPPPSPSFNFHPPALAGMLQALPPPRRIVAGHDVEGNSVVLSDRHIYSKVDLISN